MRVFILILLLPLCSLGFTADLDSYIVHIDTDFHGEDVVVFGETDEPGDIVCVVLGPEESINVRKKENLGGLWLNKNSKTIHGVPSFYAMTATSFNFIDPQEAKRHEIGMQNIHFSGDLDPEYINAILDIKKNSGLYLQKAQSVSFISEHLFRATIPLPAIVPVGAYTVKVYFVKNNEVNRALSIPLRVTKSGISAEMSEFAENNPITYGITAVLISLLLGFVIGLFFHKRR